MIYLGSFIVIEAMRLPARKPYSGPLETGEELMTIEIG
jgi:hypothetical protein